MAERGHARKIGLKDQPWMSAPETKRVLEALTREGAPVRFVGGCVRNALLGAPVQDIDIATPDEPKAVTRLLEADGIRVVPTGHRARHGDGRHRSPSFRGHLASPRCRDGRAARGRRLHARLCRGRGAARFHHQRHLCRARRHAVRSRGRARGSRGGARALHRRAAPAHRRGLLAHSSLLPHARLVWARGPRS